MRFVVALGIAFVVSGCQASRNQFPKPSIPPGASQSEIDDIYCRESPASPWYVPCRSKGSR